MPDAYPGIGLYDGTSCHYNIEHPVMKRLWEDALSVLLPALNGHPGLHSIRLGLYPFPIFERHRGHQGCLPGLYSSGARVDVNEKLWLGGIEQALDTPVLMSPL